MPVGVDAPGPASPRAAVLAGRRILLLEDQADPSLHLAEALAARGYAVCRVTNTHEAAELLRQHPPPALVLIHRTAPGTEDGPLCRREGPGERLPPTPIIVLAASRPEDTRAGGPSSTIYLPKANGTVDVLAAVERLTRRSPLEVLVVEKEPAVLRMLEAALPLHGFLAHAACCGQQAVEVYRHRHAAIDAVLLDVQMPGMDGPQTLAALRQIDPQVRCCFMTGDIGEYTADQLLALGAVRVLPKPFPTLEGLRQALWATVAQPSSGSCG